MALGHAKAQFIGNLTNDPDIRTTKSGKTVGKITLAVNTSKDSVSFFNFEAWEKKADLLQQYTQKGDRIFIEARPEQRTWKDRDGNKRSAIVFVVDEMTFIQLKEKPSFSKQEYSDTHEFNKRQADVAPDDIDEEPDYSSIPF